MLIVIEFQYFKLIIFLVLQLFYLEYEAFSIFIELLVQFNH